MNHPAFFGYGSLVNRATHDYRQAVPARLKGWRRVWRGTDLRRSPSCPLSPRRSVRSMGSSPRSPGAAGLHWTSARPRMIASCFGRKLCSIRRTGFHKSRSNM